MLVQEGLDLKPYLERMKTPVFLAIFKAKGTNPSPNMCDGWFSISLEAPSEEDARRWALHRVEMLQPWLKVELEFVLVESYKPSPDMAGPYRGLIVSM